jgi:hypothetical protein
MSDLIADLPRLALGLLCLVATYAVGGWLYGLISADPPRHARPRNAKPKEDR